MTQTISLNRFHRLSLWCGDCQNYWQLPNYLVILHGNCDENLMLRLLKANLYLYSKLLSIDVEEYFGQDYVFENEITSVFDVIRNNLAGSQKQINVLDVDIISSIESNMDSIIGFTLQMSETFSAVAEKILRNSPKNFKNKLEILKKNIFKSIESGNIKMAIDIIMDLNICGLDTLVQCVGIIFNCFYILNIEICPPENKTPGAIYCDDVAVVIERLANISTQSFLFKYKRRWLVFYRDILTECKILFANNLKLYNELEQCGNFETIENELFDRLVTRNPELCRLVTILKHNERYPKEAKEIYEWWSGRSKDQIQKIYNAMDDCLDIERKSSLLPFILSKNLQAKDRQYYEILNLLHLFDHINPELSNVISFILKIYPEVYEQIYFPDRNRYIKSNNNNQNAVAENKTSDILDNIKDKNTLRKCDNKKCQERNHGRNVIWNLNTFDLARHSMNTVFKEFIKNPEIFAEIFKYAQKNMNIAMNANTIVKKLRQKIIYK